MMNTVGALSVSDMVYMAAPKVNPKSEHPSTHSRTAPFSFLKLYHITPQHTAAVSCEALRNFGIKALVTISAALMI